MLRMYECQWCFENQVRDDGMIDVEPDGDRMAFAFRAMCPYCQRNRKMAAMVRDACGDWVYESSARDKSRKEVKPQIMCSMELG